MLLAGENVNLVFAENGDEALEKIASEKPDLVFADTSMPGMDGASLSEAIKSDPAFKSIPVVLLEGSFDVFDPEKFKRSEADAHLKKPFESSAFIGIVRQFIPQAEAQPRESVEPEPVLLQATKPMQVEPMPASAPSAATETPVRPLNAEISFHVTELEPEPVKATATPPAADAEHGFSPEELKVLVRKAIQDVVERVVWDIVPAMAEKIIREELDRLLAEEEDGDG